MVEITLTELGSLIDLAEEVGDEEKKKKLKNLWKEAMEESD